MTATQKDKNKTTSAAPSLGSVVGYKDLGMQTPVKDDQDSIGRARVGYAICVRRHLQNWRQGTVGVKGRADVAYTNHKPWRQKGTGRARAGTRRSPLWRGGGVTFGPQARTRSLSVNKKQRRVIIQKIIAQYIDQERIIIADWQINGLVPKTKQAVELLAKLGLAGHKVNLFVAPGDIVTQASFCNINSVQVTLFDEPNVYDMTYADCWVFKKADFDAFKAMVAQWI